MNCIDYEASNSHACSLGGNCLLLAKCEVRNFPAIGMLLLVM